MLLGIDGAVIVMRKAVSRLMAGRLADRGSTIMTSNHDLDNRRAYCHFSSMCSTSTHVRLTEGRSKGAP
jgi:hypothetical protein